jgi:acyl carrier protein
MTDKNCGEVLKRLSVVITETFGINDIEVNYDTVATDIPGWDSMSNSILLLSIEQNFKINIDDSLIFKNLGELVYYITEHI